MSMAKMTKENGFFSGAAMGQKEGAAAGLSTRNLAGGGEPPIFSNPR
jgi:hypothetical protein